jgi:gamma-glutamylaminecyclotransferase
MQHLVFVYGTLKQGFPHFAQNKGIRLPGLFVTAERYPLYLVGERHSPWLINRPGDGERVTGQVFEVDEAALANMDALERIAEPDGYRRIVLALGSASTQGGPQLQAFAYLKQAAHFAPSLAHVGPLREYTLKHAALYRPRQAYPQRPSA